ncbi:MAG: GNAT family N-acetyltransferase [Spirochaetales bacterium]|nr:GNAT family N-acetyltransferase [Spirochaetales bacterium]
MIEEIRPESDLSRCVHVLACSFKTVAEEFHLTEQNAPTNPAFLTIDRLQEYLKKNITLYGYYKEKELIGCIAIEKSHTENRTFFIERLAVIPEQRHKGYGRELIQFALKKIKERKGDKASIGIINENKRLKEWYIKIGFREVSVKTFSHLPFEVCFLEKVIE